MRKLTNIQQCEFAFKMIEALWEMSERRNKKLVKYKEGAEKYIENLEQENHHLKIDNAQLTAQIYNGYKKKVKERKAKCIK